jgi:hypothetical protein
MEKQIQEVHLDAMMVAIAGGTRPLMSTRMLMRFAGGKVEFPDDHTPCGLYLQVLSPALGAAPLVVVADVDALGMKNPGTSATNAAAGIVATCAPGIASAMDCSTTDLQWVCRDSMGYYDRWLPATDGRGEVAFAPLMHPQSSEQHRTQAAFEASYPAIAAVLIKHMVRMAVTDPRHFAAQAAPSVH